MQILAHYTLTPAEALRGVRAFKRFRYQVSVGMGLGLILLGLAAFLLAPGQRVRGLFMALNGLLFAGLPETVLLPERALDTAASAELEVFLRERTLLKP